MRKQIIHISVHQTSKVIAAMHAAMITVLFILPTALGHWFHGQIISGILILILLPLFIWLLMYIGYVIACWFYNLVIPWTGGIEVEVADTALKLEPAVKTAAEENVVKPEQVDVPPDERPL